MPRQVALIDANGQKVDSLELVVGEALSTPGGGVTSVFGRFGIVVATLGDYLASQVTNNSGVAGATVANALDTLAASGAPVASVFGRVGAVVAAVNDYAASQVNNDSGVTGATVKAALDALAAAIPSVPVASVFGRVGAVVAAVNDYAASQVNNDSGVTGATVKAALDALAALSPQNYQWWATAAPAINADRFPSTGRTALTTTAVLSAPWIVPFATTAYALTYNNCNLALATDAVVVTLQVAPAGSNVFADTALTLTIPGGTVTGTVISDVAHTVALGAGDRLAVKLRQAGATAQANWFASFSVQTR